MSPMLTGGLCGAGKVLESQGPDSSLALPYVQLPCAPEPPPLAGPSLDRKKRLDSVISDHVQKS